MNHLLKLKNTIKYPTSLIVNGVTNLGLEIAESLLEQGGYVVFIDAYNEENLDKVIGRFGDSSLISFIDYAAIPHLEEDMRRLDYVFYLAHESIGLSTGSNISTQNFLKYSNYLDTTLSVTSKFEAKLLLTTSIRSHLRLMDSMDIEVNYGKDAKEKHTVYTDMEVQRYAESLVLEYVNKAALDARVIRVGEIIGDGMDFSKQTSFTNLVVQAVVGEELTLKNDGLETEWYVHLLDAAYGVIRAQFTKNIKGEVLSLSYENAISDLSLAYRLQEAEPNAKEIAFEPEEMQLAPLKLHKPAANLVRIGWRPKVEFEQSVAESLAAAKQLALDGHSGGGAKVDDSILNKLGSFLQMPQSDNVSSSRDIEGSGPVHRLIAERKKQEEAREISMSKADKKVKYLNNKRTLTIGEKANRWIYKSFFDTKTNFGILRSVTPIQFFSFLVTVVVTGYLYFSFFAPAIVIGRNMFLIDSTMTELEVAFNDRDIKELEVKARNLNGLFEESSEMLRSFEGVASIVAADKAITETFELLDIYKNYSEGMLNVAYSAVPIQDYLDTYESNISYRPSAENYITTSSGTDYSLFLDDLNSRRVFAELGETQLIKAERELRAYQVNSLPSELIPYIGKLNTRLVGFSELAEYAGIGKYAPDTLGAKLPRTYLFFLLDNSRPMPIGGSISAYALITLQNGSISDMRVQPIDEFTPNLSKLPTYAKDAINNNSSDNFTKYSVTDLARINDTELFSDVTKELWETATGKDIDMVGLFNLEGLGDMLDLTGDLSLEGQIVNNISLLSVLATLQTTNPTIKRRNDLSAQLLALSLEEVFGNLDQHFVPVLKELSNSANKKDLIIARNDLKINESIEFNKFYGDIAITADMPIKVGFIADQQIISPTRFPTFTKNLEITIRSDSSLNVRSLVKFPGIGNIDEVSLCVPLVAKKIEVTGVSFTRVRDRRNNNEKCSVVDIISESEVSFEWDTIAFESSSDQEYNLSIGQVKPAGTQVEYSVEISLASSLSFSEIHPSVTSLGGRVAISENLQKDQIIELVITK